MAVEPGHLVLQQLRAMRVEIAESHAELRSEMNSLCADVASDLLAMQAKSDAEHKATREQIVGLRRAVVEYHSAVLGHGALISDPEARVRRLELKVGSRTRNWDDAPDPRSHLIRAMAPVGRAVIRLSCLRPPLGPAQTKRRP